MPDYSSEVVAKIESTSLCKSTVLGCFTDFGPYLFILVFTGIILYCVYLYVREKSPRKNDFSLLPPMNILQLPELVRNLTLRQKIVMLYLLGGVLLLGQIFSNILLGTGKLDHFIGASIGWFVILIPVYYVSPNKVVNQGASKILNFILITFIVVSIVWAFLSAYLHIDIFQEFLAWFPLVSDSAQSEF